MLDGDRTDCLFHQVGMLLGNERMPGTYGHPAKWPVVSRRTPRSVLRLDAGRFEKYFAIASSPSAPFSSVAFGPSVCVLT